MVTQRTLTALILAPCAIALVLLAPTWLFGFVIAIAVLASLWEWSRMSGVASRIQRAIYLAFVAGCLCGLWLLHNPALWWSVIVIGALWWLLALLWLRQLSFAAAPTAQNVALKLLAGLLVSIPAWLAIVEIHQSPGYGRAWALLALVLVWGADTFAFLAGSRWGTTKLAPRISPGKTTAGVWGALAGSVVVGAIGGALLGLRNGDLLALVVLALLTVAFSIVGDLFESLIKRQANVKDSGRMFPGHGGLFDRLDSAFAALPIFAIGKALLDLTLPS